MTSTSTQSEAPAAVAMDIVDLMDALRVGDHRRIRLGSADGRSHGAAVAGTLQGHRRRERLFVTNRRANMRPLPPVAEYGWWYQHYFATERGRIGYGESRHRR